jgi:Cu(I)/Ag(I) efflux system membrane fusion protein
VERLILSIPKLLRTPGSNLIRVTVPNSNGQLKPGMPAYVLIKNKMTNALTLPINAVLRKRKMNVVWVKSGKNSYKIKMVTTGLESGDRIEIKSGLQGWRWWSGNKWRLPAQQRIHFPEWR